MNRAKLRKYIKYTLRVIFNIPVNYVFEMNFERLYIIYSLFPIKVFIFLSTTIYPATEFNTYLFMLMAHTVIKKITQYNTVGTIGPVTVK